MKIRLDPGSSPGKKADKQFYITNVKEQQGRKLNVGTALSRPS